MKLLERWFVTRKEYEQAIEWLENKIDYLERDIERLRCTSKS